MGKATRKKRIGNKITLKVTTGRKKIVKSKKRKNDFV